MIASRLVKNSKYPGPSFVRHTSLMLQVHANVYKSPNCIPVR